MADSPRAVDPVVGSLANRAPNAVPVLVTLVNQGCVMSKPGEGAPARSGWMRPEVAEVVLPLPRILEALAAVRRRVRAVLADWDLAPEVADDALLVVSEMITNAVTHALPPAALRLSRVTGQGRCTLRIEVTDAGPAAHSRRGVPDTLPEEHGRGIAIIAALSSRCGTRVHAGGVTRWADLRAA